MTATETDVAPVETPAAADVAAPPTDPPSRPRLGWRGGVAAVVVVVVTLAFLVLLFEGPVARQWYRTRQDHLASDLVVPRPGLATGQAATVVQAPNVGLNAVVIEGDTPENLRSGPGHRADTPLPGGRGNAVVMGHRTGWGAPFANLHELKRGNLVVARRRTKNAVVVVVFTVISKRTVDADDVRPLAASTDHRLTLVTSDGGVDSTDRLVVTAVSGSRGRLRGPSPGLDGQTPGGSPIFNWFSLVALVAIGAAIGAYLGLRRRHHVVAVAVIVTPLAVLGVLCVLLNLDIWLLPPLR